MAFDKAEFAAWETHLLGIWEASGLSCGQGGLAGALGVGPLSWPNCRKSIRRPLIGKNDTSSSWFPESPVITVIAMWLHPRLGRILQVTTGLSALHRDFVWIRRCQKPQQASCGRRACLHCPELLL